MREILLAALSPLREVQCFLLTQYEKFVNTETSDNSWNNEREFHELYTPYVYGELWSK